MNEILVALNKLPECDIKIMHNGAKMGDTILAITFENKSTTIEEVYSIVSVFSLNLRENQVEIYIDDDPDDGKQLKMDIHYFITDANEIIYGFGPVQDYKPNPSSTTQEEE